MKYLIMVFLILGLVVLCGLSFFGMQISSTSIHATQQDEVSRATATGQAEAIAYTATSDMRTATAQLRAATATAQRQATEVQQIYERNSANGTAQAAQSTAEYLNSQATATAEEENRRRIAEAVRRTEIAVANQQTAEAESAIATSQAYATATERAWIITQTAQAGYTSQTAQAFQATATRQADIAGVERTAESIQAESAMLSLEQKRATNLVSAVAPWAIGIAMAVVALFIAWRWSKVQQVGKVLVFNGQLAYDPNRNPLPWMRVMDGGQIDAPVLAPPQMHADTVRRDQAIDALKAMPSGSARPQLQSAFMAPRKEEPQPAPAIILPEQANWERLLSWSFERNKRLPLGIGAGEHGIGVDPEETPHLMIAGTSGAGKSRCGILPISACALSAGFRVVTMNAAGGDYTSLSSHPNFTELEGDGSVIADALEAVVAEMERRSHELRSMGVSTLSRANRPDLEPVMVVVDELVALAWQSSPALRDRIWRSIIQITSKGRKLGLMLVVATTDPTHRTLGREGLTVRDNCAVMTFRVKSGAVSQAVLGQYGAEELGKDQFLVRLINDMIRGVAFHPSDDEVKSFLASRPVVALPISSWIGEGKGQLQPDISDLKSRIIGLHQQGKTITQICNEIYGTTGGRFWYLVRKTVEDNTSTATSTNTSTNTSTKTEPEVGAQTVEVEANQKEN